MSFALVLPTRCRERRGLLRSPRRAASLLAAAALFLTLTACGGSEDTVASPPSAGAQSVVVSDAAASSSANEDAAVPADSATSSATTGRKQVQASAPDVLARFRANGWYWNPAESGTGFMFEAQGSQGFVAFFMYEEGTGKPVWYAATGPISDNPDGSLSFSAELRYFMNGQALSSATYRTPTYRAMGTVRITVTGANATVQFPQRTMQATRFDFGGVGSATTATQPETGWYWHPDEGGRGYAIEVQNNELFMAVFHYNDDGTPTWHAFGGDMSSGTLTAPLRLYGEGQSLTSAYRVSSTRFDIGGLTLSFRNPCAGQIQRSGSAAVGIRRYVFGDLQPGEECHSVARMADVAGLQSGPARLLPGDQVHGRIESAGDLDAYGIALEANVRYQFDLVGYAVQSGTLWDPVLRLYDSRLAQIAESDDAADLDSRIVFTPTTSGVYYLAASGYKDLTGSFVLSASGVAPNLVAQPVPALASYAGRRDGVYVGGARGTLSLSIDSQGAVTGSAVSSAMTWQAATPLSGSVAAGGIVRLTGSGIGGTLNFTGYLSPAGDLSGTWATNTGAGIFVATRGGTAFPR